MLRISRHLGLIALLALVLSFACSLRLGRFRPDTGAVAKRYILQTTGYCKCGDCCGWKRNWFGLPVIASGPNRGKPKKVGITASGTRAQPGTLAADTDLFPFGTVMHVPGYGYGRVEDRGRDIKGYHIDLYFRSHAEAERWGRHNEEVRVWFPR